MLASLGLGNFNPPGQLAVAKGEQLSRYPGGQFVLNILADGNHLGLMTLPKPFAEDRFAGVATDQTAHPFSVTPLPI